MQIQTNLYDTVIYFGLTFQGKMTYILEPNDWDKISNHMPRDPNQFGFQSDFLEDKYGMVFSFVKKKPSWSLIELTGGAEILQYVYETVGLGPNEIVYFEFGVLNKNTPQRIKQWRIVFDGYECDRVLKGGVSVSIEKTPFQAKYRSRNSSPCTINSYSNMDGNLLNPITPWTLRLHSKTLQLISQGVSAIPGQTEIYHSSAGDPNPLVLQPDQGNLSINELPDVFNQPVGFSNIGGNPSIPTEVDIFADFLCQYTCKDAGLLNIENTCSFDFWLWHDDRKLFPADLEPEWTVIPRIVVQRLVSGVWTNVTSLVGTTILLSSGSPDYFFGTCPSSVFVGIISGSDRDNCNKVPVSFSFIQNNIQVEVGDNVYVHCVVNAVGSVSDAITLAVQFDNYIQQKIYYSQLTITPSTSCQAFRAFDLINQMLENITGFKNRLKSNFFSPGGFGYKYLFANGYSIRNYGGIAYMFKKDLASFLNDLQCIFCIGIGFQEIDGNDYMVIEGISDFFRRRNIITFNKSLEWKDVHGAKYCFNKIDLGYNKFEGLNIIQQDEYCTNGSFLTQYIQFANNVLSKKGDIIAAGYLLENQRRNQFIANPGQSLTNDEDIFIAATSEPLRYDHQGISISLPYSDPRYIFTINQTSLGLSHGDQITIYDALNPTGVTYTIDEEVSGYPIIGEDQYFLVEPASADSDSDATVFIVPPSPNEIFAERNNCFEICSNCIDPSTIYNGRLSVSHLLYNWRPLLGVGLYFVDPLSQNYTVSQIVTTLIKMNSAFTTKFLPIEEFQGNVGTEIIVELKNKWIGDYLKNGESIFTPEGAEVKLKIGWNQMDIIRKALTGELGDDTKDFGGVTIPDDRGEFWFCHIMDIQHNPVTQIATLQVQKVNKVIPIE